MFSFEQIKELIALVTEHGLDGIEIERSGFRLRIDGQGTTHSVAPAPAAPASATPSAAPTPVASTPGPAAVAAAEPADDAGLPADAHVVKSPIVGTFYAAASPDADPYVKVGDRVERGQVLCIVEAMKLMNEIESDADGVVLEIIPANAQAVEYGEPLFVIR